ncbi:AMMECR1 domain-containing protein [Parasitella parasitica]|nr:AMMECR1 domain-containing protein [Parasitella parasitica]
MDLTQLKEGLANGTRSAEHYLQQFGTDVISALKNTVTVLGPEEQASTALTTTDNATRSPRIFATRKDALLAKMQTNENTYLQEPELSKKGYDQEKKILDTFNSSFNIEEYTDEIAQLLVDYPNLRNTMDRLVPVQVSYTSFWQRYFYHAWKIDQDEQKRQIIVQGAHKEDEDEADFKWDSDEEDNATVKNETPNKVPEADTSKIRTSTSNSEDTDDFSHISEPTSSTTSPPLKSSQAEEEWVKAEKKKSDDEEDSDILISHLNKKTPPQPTFPNDSYPLFVTWHKKTKDNGLQLRGCIGNFNPMPLHTGLSKYALISALQDHRFPAITLYEIPFLTCAVSLLTDFEKANNYLDWEVGTHGIWIEFTQTNGEKETATYLPEVMTEQSWTKKQAIHSLLKKGNFRGTITEDYCLNSITLTRYQSQKIEQSYEEVSS